MLQFSYTWHVLANDFDLILAAANVGSHYVLNNSLQIAFIMLWVRSRFWLAELILAINFFNLKALYLQYSTTPSFVHMSVLSGPLSWTFMAILWNGAVMINACTLTARILAHVAIWSILSYGGFFLVIYQDHTVGFALSYLTAGKSTTVHASPEPI